MATTTCPKCGRSGRLPEGTAAVVRCPGCGERFAAGAAVPAVRASRAPAVARERPLRATVVPAPAEVLTRCGFCGEEILAGARKCKHCGEYLDPELRANAPPVVVQTTVVNVTGPEEWTKGAVAAMAVLIPGGGHYVQGKILRGMGWSAAILVGYACFLAPGLILHGLSIVAATKDAPDPGGGLTRS